ncbi:hypothetical protein ABMA27_011021 [Loxostege sticticalis]|uniref:BPTI/Kunitz inhibitor domain-containing protein n=1 Tax=Loxostege sticticalis TaxID=481309 RepID=A0ABR3H318_LOXSC
MLSRNNTILDSAFITTFTMGSNIEIKQKYCLDSRCALPIDRGSCNGIFPSIGYNVELGECEEFVYGGCNGNDNRFWSLEDCQRLCHD